MQVVATPAAKGGERDVGGSHKRSKGNGLHACGGGAALVNANLASAVGGGMGAFVAGAAMAGAALGLLMAQQGSGRAGGGILGLDLLGSPAALAGAAEAAVAGQGQAQGSAKSAVGRGGHGSDAGSDGGDSSSSEEDVQEHASAADNLGGGKGQLTGVKKDGGTSGGGGGGRRGRGRGKRGKKNGKVQGGGGKEIASTSPPAPVGGGDGAAGKKGSAGDSSDSTTSSSDSSDSEEEIPLPKKKEVASAGGGTGGRALQTEGSKTATSGGVDVGEVTLEVDREGTENAGDAGAGARDASVKRRRRRRRSRRKSGGDDEGMAKGLAGSGNRGNGSIKKKPAGLDLTSAADKGDGASAGIPGEGGRNVLGEQGVSKVTENREKKARKEVGGENGRWTGRAGPASFQGAGRVAKESVSKGAKRLVFDDDGNQIEAAPGDTDARLKIGEWSAPASHKKAAFQKQQKEQKHALASASATGRRTRGGGAAGGKVSEGHTQVSRSASLKGSASLNGSASACLEAGTGEATEDDVWERYGVLDGWPVVGDELAFKVVELQGWVPNVSAYKRGIVVAWSAVSQEISIQVTFAPSADKVGPTFAARHPRVE